MHANNINSWANNSMMTPKHNEQGFTLPELLVLAGFIILLTLSSILLLKPQSYDAEMNNGQRRADIAHLAQGLLRYKATHGQFPAHLPSEETAIGSEHPQYNLCTALVPKFMKDLPLDPQAGLKYKNSDNYDEAKEPCNGHDLVFTTGYTIQHGADGAITLKAPVAEGEKIEIVIR